VRNEAQNIMATVPDPKNGLKQGIIWVQATAILRRPTSPLAQKLIKHVVSRIRARSSLLEDHRNVVTNKAVASLYRRGEEHPAGRLHVHAYENRRCTASREHRRMLAIWSEAGVGAVGRAISRRHSAVMRQRLPATSFGGRDRAMAGKSWIPRPNLDDG
jgi:hypothetical protein